MAGSPVARGNALFQFARNASVQRLSLEFQPLITAHAMKMQLVSNNV